jgi:hypothetical protein
MPSPVAVGRPDVPAAPAAPAAPVAEPAEAAGATATVNTAVARTGAFGLGLAAVTATVSLTCSPLVADVGTATAARSSTAEEVTLPSLQVFLPSPLPQTVKLGVAVDGLVLREAVTPVDVEPQDDTKILKFAVPPGATLVLPDMTLTLSHSFTNVGPEAMKTASDALDVAPDAVDVAPDAVDVAPDALGDAVAEGDGVGVALPDDVVPPPAPVDDVEPPPVGDTETVGVELGAEVVGVAVGDEEDGLGLGVNVDVTQGTVAAAVRAWPPFSSVSAVVPSTPALTHKAVAMIAMTDPCLRTLTRLTPFLRSSLECSSFTPYRHIMSYP